MRLPDPRNRRRELSNRILFPALVALLAAFSIWCLWLLWRAEKLHDDVEFHFAWIARMQSLIAELEATRNADPALPGSAAATEGLGSLRAQLGEFDHGSDPNLLIAVRNLRLAIEDLEEKRRDDRDASPDEIWRVSVAAIDTSAELETVLRERLVQLNRRLGGLRRSLYSLVLGALALAGSNFGFLIVAHRRRQELEAAHSEAVARASHDLLTGLWNREAILRRLELELVRAQRSQSPLGVILADLDRFAEVNALIGQSQGDDILRQVGELLGSLVRPYDTLGRFGGDSFLMVLPACDDLATTRVAERLRRGVEEHEFALDLGRLELHLSLVQATIRRAVDTDVDTVIRELQQRLADEKPEVEKSARPGAG